MSATKCSFCGSMFTNQGILNGIRVIKSDIKENGQTASICEACLQKALEKISQNHVNHSNRNDYEMPQEKPFSINHKIPAVKTPKEIFVELTRYVIGQHEYLCQVALFGYYHVKRIHMLMKNIPEIMMPKKMNFWAMGPSGTGKTHSLKVLSKIIGVPLIIGDAASLTEAGYVGGDIEDLVCSLIAQSDNDIFRASTGIICIDEIDKLAITESGQKDPSGEGVQQGLLKLVEGKDLQVMVQNKEKKAEKKTISTDNIGWIALGAFSGLENNSPENGQGRIGFRNGTAFQNPVENEQTSVEECLIQYGMLPELIGRFPLKSILKPLGEDDLKRIMIEPDDSILKTELHRFREEKIDLVVKDSAVDVIARKAALLGLGARPLMGEFHNVLKDLELEFFGTDKLSEVVVFGKADGTIGRRLKLRQG